MKDKPMNDSTGRGLLAFVLLAAAIWQGAPVSYTHLDVYKRQPFDPAIDAPMPAPRSSGFRVTRLVPIVVVLALLAAAAWWWKGRDQAGEQRYRTAAVESGDIRVAISATGTLSALSTVCLLYTSRCV